MVKIVFYSNNIITHHFVERFVEFYKLENEYTDFRFMDGLSPLMNFLEAYKNSEDQLNLELWESLIKTQLVINNKNTNGTVESLECSWVKNNYRSAAARYIAHNIFQQDTISFLRDQGFISVLLNYDNTLEERRLAIEDKAGQPIAEERLSSLQFTLPDDLVTDYKFTISIHDKKMNAKVLHQLMLNL